MTRIPDEIKKGLECCSMDDLHCGQGCPYKDDCLEEARYKGLESDALAYIRQLEAERDAAVNDLKNVCELCSVCCACKDRFDGGESCRGCISSNHWQWRGVQKEEAK